jgi:hypothetical protein
MWGGFAALAGASHAALANSTAARPRAGRDDSCNFIGRLLLAYLCKGSKASANALLIGAKIFALPE